MSDTGGGMLGEPGSGPRSPAQGSEPSGLCDHDVRRIFDLRTLPVFATTRFHESGIPGGESAQVISGGRPRCGVGLDGIGPSAAVTGVGSGGGGNIDYSELVFVLRDPNGVPIPTTFGSTVCVQPISYTEILGTKTVNPVDGRDVYLVPLKGALPGTLEDEVCDAQNEADLVEVELERLNLVRTTDDVLWSKLSEVGTRLANAGTITLDGAGRIATDGVAIDASPELAAVYAATEGDTPAPPPDDGAGRPGGGNQVA